MRVKKNEPLSNPGKRVVCVVEKGTLVTLATSVLEVTRIASPTTPTKGDNPSNEEATFGKQGEKEDWFKVVKYLGRH